MHRIEGSAKKSNVHSAKFSSSTCGNLSVPSSVLIRASRCKPDYVPMGPSGLGWRGTDGHHALSPFSRSK